MRRNLVEIVFELDQLMPVWAFVDRVADSGRRAISTVAPHVQPGGSDVFPRSFKEMKQILTDPDGSFATTLERIAIPGGEITEPTLWIRPSGPFGFLLEINFYTTAVSVMDGKVEKCLLMFATTVAEQVGARLFYAGLEPAGDIGTRLFTTSALGPLSWAELCDL